MEKKQQRAALYVRVSTTEQNPEGQEAELKEYAANRGWGISGIYRDKTSGAVRSRPALDELMADARKKKMDIILVWKFDRFARSVSHLLSALETFRSVGIEFVSVSEAIDTTTAAGRMVFTVLGAVAELERSLIGERVRMGVSERTEKGRAAWVPVGLKGIGTRPTAGGRFNVAPGKIVLAPRSDQTLQPIDATVTERTRVPSPEASRVKARICSMETPRM